MRHLSSLPLHPECPDKDLKSLQKVAPLTRVPLGKDPPAIPIQKRGQRARGLTVLLTKCIQPSLETL